MNVKQIVLEEIEKFLQEDGATSTCAINADGSGDSSFGVAYPAFADKETADRGKKNKNGSISWGKANEDTDVLSKPIYKCK